jgi:hypothetical protein
MAGREILCQAIEFILMIVAPEINEDLRKKLVMVAESFQHLTGKPLVDEASPEGLWIAPRVIVAHGTEADPLFFYGNRMALEAFAMDFASFTRLPSRYSAELLNREERTRLLARVTRDGFIDDYSGVRISAKGQRFRIAQAVVWNLLDREGVIHGQAATFDQWVVL